MIAHLKRHWKYWAIGLAALLVLTLLFAPQRNSHVLYGSTYGRSPSGYGAWYQYMAEQKTPIQRWQKPLGQFLTTQGQVEPDKKADSHSGGQPDSKSASQSDNKSSSNSDSKSGSQSSNDGGKSASPKRPVTLLQVGDSPIWGEDSIRDSQALESWLAQGNRLVVLRSQGEVTAAPSRSEITTPLGPVILETRRRQPDPEAKSGEETAPKALEVRAEKPSQSQGDLGPQSNSSATEFRQVLVQAEPPSQPFPDSDPENLEPQHIGLLEDDYGVIVWAQGKGKGSIIEAVTPDLGANAYQKAPGNFAFLAGLVKAGEAELWVNEYSHGYQDKDPKGEDTAVSWGDYFLETPLMLAWVQLLVLLAIAIIALNRRWGLPRPLALPVLNNSEAYIGALAGVLRRSNSHGFVLRQWQAAEQRRLQRQLGLGNRLVELDLLLQSWEQQTGESSSPLQSLLTPPAQGSGSLAQLKRWLANLDLVRQISRQHFS